MIHAPTFSIRSIILSYREVARLPSVPALLELELSRVEIEILLCHNPSELEYPRQLQNTVDASVQTASD
jgi:hypothetical protein